ncbi:MAG: glycosyltransferase, partial [Nitrospirota bacterium]|nr:glycosyltransferase [Nitrospirota bacterium]
DMECFAQAKVFQETGITFHCLKFGTDFCDGNTIDDFNRNLELFRDAVKRLFAFSTPHTGGITAMIPVHNREHTIQRALDSVLSQSVMPDEIIVVDDASTDRTGEILKGYGDVITLITLAANSGPSRARNEGVSHAKTEWIAFLDSDDCWERDKLKNQTAYLKQYPFYQIMQSDELWIRNGKRVNPCKHHRKPEGWIWEQSLERCLVSPSGVLIKRSLLQQYGGFDEGLPVCEDYDLWLKISRCHPVGLDPVPSVIKHGGHEDQLSRRYPAMDSFRVRSLYRMLKNEHSPAYCRKIISVLEKKLTILISGYEKRNRAEDVRECREMLETVQECRSTAVPMQGQPPVSAR